jgi:tRNA(Ile)-lysidine synthase
MKKILDNLLPRFEEHLRDRRFFRAGQKILVACSGGPDSVALFHLLQRLAPRYSWKLGLIHFNHQLRPGAAKMDERSVKALARKFRVPFYCGTGNVMRAAQETKTSIEEAARKMRYDFFLRISKAKKFPAVVLAHTRDDQAETVLMRVLQGTGLRGLQGIREKFRLGGTTLVRPLLGFTKKEILDFGRAAKVAYRKDKSNDSSKFLRNRIRLELIPRLQRDFNPRVVEALSRIPAIVAGESALIAELEEKAWAKTFKRICGKKIELRRSVLLKFPPALQFRIVERALKKLDRQSGLSFEAWDRIRRGLSRPRFCSSLPRDIDFALTSKKVTIYKKNRRG